MFVVKLRTSARLTQKHTYTKMNVGAGKYFGVCVRKLPNESVASWRINKTRDAHIHIYVICMRI